MTKKSKSSRKKRDKRNSAVPKPSPGLTKSEKGIPEKTRGDVRRKLPLKIVAWILALGIMAGAGGTLWHLWNRNQAKDFNIILVTIDALRPDYLSCYGYQKAATPHIDLLAREGLLFQNAFANAPNTYRSVASLVTSRYPETVVTCETLDNYSQRIHFFSKVVKPLSPAFPTLAEILRDSGWNTFAVLTNPLLKENLQFPRGFEKIYHCNDENKELMELIPSLSASSRSRKDTHFLTTVAMELIEIHKKEKFFFWVHYLDPHMPYGDPWIPSFPARGDYKGPIKRGFNTWYLVNEGKTKIFPEDILQLQYLYERDIDYVDMQLGRLFDYLKKTGLWEKSLVILSADHGEQFYEHGELSHVTLYWETIRVPLLIKPPGESTPQTMTEFVELIDLGPTILETAGIDIPPSFQGKSFAPLLEGRARLKMAGWEPKPFFISSCNGYFEPQKAIRDQRYTLIYSTETKTIELFDRETDPGEQKDISRDNPALVQDLLKELKSHLKEIALETSADDTPVQLDEKELRALGYIK